MTSLQPPLDSTLADILIVDDTPANLRFLALTLSQQGYKVRCVTNGQMALTAAFTKPPDLVLLDICMPGLDGYEVCQQLKHHQATADVPVIFLSALNEAFDKVAAFKVGGADYISKPFQFEEILVRIQHQLALKSAQAKIKTLNADLEQRVRDRTEALRQMNDALQESEARFRYMANSAPVLLWMTDPEGHCNFFNQYWLDFRGRSLEEELGEGWLQGLHSDDREAYIAHYQQAFQAQESFHSEYRLMDAKGVYHWILEMGKPRYSPEGKFMGMIGSSLDISDRKQAEQELQAREKQFRLIFELAPAGMSIMSIEGKFLNVNQSLCHLLGYSATELLERNWMDITHPDDLPANQNLVAKIIRGELAYAQFEKRYITRSGATLHTVVNITLMRDREDQPVHLIVQVIDITDQKRAEEQLIHDATHDGLTGLVNRGCLLDRLRLTLKLAERYSSYRFAVLLVDLDRFKRVNESLGPVIGDQLLIAVANVLIRCVGTSDTVARLGGDEFAILIEDIDDIQDAIRVAERIQSDLSLPFKLVGHDVITTASIGLVLSTPDYEHGSELLRDADIAMYRAKENGRNRYEIFNKVMHAKALQLLKLEADLQRAIAQDEFVAHYQPIVSLKTGKLAGFEALIRWQHPERGMVPPTEFIPLAEDNGMIVAIGEWILRAACTHLRAWQQEFTSAQNLRISVNLAGRQLQADTLLSQIDQVLADTGLAGADLKLELTESMLMDNSAAIVSRLHQLKERRIQLSIDDFGTGFSSLNYLHQFPIDTLKIDRSFVDQMDANREHSGIVQAIVNMAHALNMNAIAEGIEQRSQIQQLQALGCEMGQGYFFAKPLPESEVRSLLAQDPHWEMNHASTIN
jgi:diguanylate cyclase (GGDEF)-like protein/PAS domain S-box-containing protein